MEAGKEERPFSDHGCRLAFSQQNALGPLGGEPGEQLKIGHRVVQTPAQTAQQHKAPVSPFQPLAQGEAGVRLVLDPGEAEDLGMVWDGAQRVEIPYYKAGVDAQPGQGLIALVGRNDQVARDRREDETGVQGHGPHHIAERCIVCHMGLPSVDSRAEMGAGPQAGMELAS